jgi:hypothetical protein
MQLNERHEETGIALANKIAKVGVGMMARCDRYQEPAALRCLPSSPSRADLRRRDIAALLGGNFEAVAASLGWTLPTPAL